MRTALNTSPARWTSNPSSSKTDGGRDPATYRNPFLEPERPISTHLPPSLFEAVRCRSTEETNRYVERLLASVGARAKVVRLAPVWKPGYVAVIRFREGDTPFTYIHGQRKWPGERFDKTDTGIDELYAEGKARPIVQSTGEAFDKGRL